MMWKTTSSEIQSKPTMNSPIRTFIAIEVPDHVKDVLSNVVQTIQKIELINVRWVRTESIHLTVKFIGDINPNLVPQIQTVLEDSARESSAFCLGLSNLGTFPSLFKPKVLWIGLQGELESLTKLQLSTEKQLESIGFPKSRIRFTPHLTLGRIRSALTTNQLSRLSEALKDPPTHIHWRVSELHLVQSTLTPTGALHHKLSTVSLDGCPMGA